MRFITRASSRALITVAATGAAMSIALLAGAAPAWAHVHVDADNPTPGSYSVLTFNVPNESENGALTTQLSVALPNVESASTEAMPVGLRGWIVMPPRAPLVQSPGRRHLEPASQRTSSHCFGSR